MRKIRQIVIDVHATFDADFSELYSSQGCVSITPERLLRASLFQVFYSPTPSVG